MRGVQVVTVYSLAVEPLEGVVLCAGGSDGVLHLYDMHNHRLLHVLRRADIDGQRYWLG